MRIALLIICFACLDFFAFAAAVPQSKPIDICSVMQADPYELNNIDSAMSGLKVGFLTSFSAKSLYWNGDAVSIAVLKTTEEKELTDADPSFVGAYVQAIRIAFGKPEIISSDQNKTPKITLLLLDYLEGRVRNPGLQSQIQELKSKLQAREASGIKMEPARPLTTKACARLPGPDPYSLIPVGQVLRNTVGPSSGEGEISMLGDGVSIAVLKIADEDEILRPNADFVKTYLLLAQTGFSDPGAITLNENRDDRVTLFLLSLIESKMDDPVLLDEIRYTREYIAARAQADFSQ